MALADLLRGRDATSIRELAEELGVGRRTLLRDLAALRERGLPITGEPGPGGGVRLEGDRGITAVHLFGRDVDKGVPRTFRTDRMARPRLLREITFRPDLDVIRSQLPDLERWRPLAGRWA